MTAPDDFDPFAALTLWRGEAFQVRNWRIETAAGFQRFVCSLEWRNDTGGKSGLCQSGWDATDAVFAALSEFKAITEKTDG